MILTSVLQAIGLFAATNIDDIIVLTELVQAQGNDMLTMLTGDFAR